MGELMTYSITRRTRTTAITLDTVKQQADIEGSISDVLLTVLLRSAIMRLEDEYKFAIDTLTVSEDLRDARVFLSLYPVMSVTSVTDSDGNVLVEDVDYETATDQLGRLCLLFERRGRHTVVYSAGAQGDIPAQILRAIYRDVYANYEKKFEGDPLAESLAWTPYKNI